MKESEEEARLLFSDTYPIQMISLIVLPRFESVLIEYKDSKLNHSFFFSSFSVPIDILGTQ